MDDTKQSITKVEQKPNPLPSVDLESSPNTRLNQWLETNNYELVTTALPKGTTFLGDKGFIMPSQPVLAVSCQEKEDK